MEFWSTQIPAWIVGAPLVGSLFFRGERCLALWGFGWLVLIATGVLGGLGGFGISHPILGVGANATGPIFAALMLAGCLSFAGRPLPRWFPGLAAGGAAASGGIAALAFGADPPGNFALELPMLAAGVAVLCRFALRPGAHFADRVVAVGSLGLLVADALELLAWFDPSLKPTAEATWVAAGLGAGCPQLVAVAERRRLETQRLSEERELLRRVAVIGASAADPREALSRLAREMRYQGLFVGFGIWSANEAGTFLELLAAHPPPESWSAAMKRPSLARPLLARVRDTSELIVFDDVSAEQNLLPYTRAFGIERLALAPLRASGEFFGIVAIALPGRPELDAATRRFIADLADEIALVFANARLRERERAQTEELLAERRRMRALVETAPVGILLIGSQGNIEFANRHVSELLEIDPVLLEGPRATRRTLDLLLPRLEAASVAALERFRAGFAAATAEIEEFELRIRGPRPRVLCVATNSILRGDGTPSGRVCIVQDVTERLEASERAQRAQRLEMLGTLASGIAHDFNNRLTAILGSAAELGRTLEQSAQRESLAEIVDAARRCAEITSGLVAFSRSEAAAPRPTDVRSTLDQVERLLRPSLPAGVSLEIAPEAPGAVLADPGALHRVLMNLLVNARDALGQRGSIRLEARRFAAEGEDLVEITVRDDGPGMDELTRQRIFDPFFTTKPTADGMGLAIAHGLVEAHGGSLSVQSELGKGCCFRVSWPGVQALPAARVQPGRVAPAERREGPVAVLLAEDEASVRRLASRALERRGYEVIAVEDGLAALEAFRANRGRIRAAVFDLHMPKLSGLAALARIREEAPDLPALLMSGHPEREGVAWPAGLRLLPKPFGMQQLIESVGELLESEAGEPGR